MLVIIFYFIISFLEAILLSFFALNLVNIKLNYKQLLLIGIGQGIFGLFIRYLDLPFGIHTFIQLLIFSLIIYIIVFISYKICFLLTLISLCIYIIIQSITIPVLLFITGFTLETISNKLYLQFLFLLPSFAFIIIINFIINYYKHNFRKYFNLIVKVNKKDLKPELFIESKSYPLIILFFLQNFFMVLFFSVNYVILEKGNKLTVVIYLTVTLIIFLTISSIIMIRRILHLIQGEIEAKNQLETLQNIQDLVYTIRTQRHDFCHHLQTVYGLMEIEAFKAAQNYIRNNISEVAATSELVKTDNLGISALLYTKAGIAEAKGIKLSIDIRSSLRKLPVKTIDANTILGNLIDNAIEEVIKMRLEKKIVEVVISQDLDHFIFEVINIGSQIDEKQLEKIFEPEVSTKKVGRGMGLYSVQQLVVKYNGKIKVISNNQKTNFLIQIPY